MPTRPNVLLVLTDQERADCTDPDGPPVETPTLDRLSAEGVRFERAYTPIGICTSARASLLSGRYPHSHGMLNNSHEADAIRTSLPADVRTFPERLAASGYDLSYAGKWHVGRDRTPADFGFDYRGGSDRHHDDIDDAFREYRRERGAPVDETDLEAEIRTADGTLVAARTPVDVAETRAYFLAERTIDALAAHDEREGPFFHRTDFYGPHHPYVVPEPYASLYDPDEVALPDSYAETFDGKPRVHENYLDYRGVRGFDRETWSRAIALYRGFVTMIDDQVGRILEALDEYGLAGETVVVHASDHGDFAGGHRQFNKGPLMYEDTYRIPLQVRWPGVVDPGSTCGAPVRLHDLAPTFLAVGGLDVPDGWEARSLLPILESGRAPEEWPDFVVSEYHGDEFGLYTQRMVRTREHKFVYNGPDRNELYDLRADPDELHNLIDHPGYADVRRDLQTRLVEWMRATGDPIREWVPNTFAGDDRDRDSGD